jgi:acetyl-CoA acetyltransferase
MQFLEKTVGITGIGRSEVGRHVNRDGLDLTVEACLRAIDDAGLTRADIDGVSTYPGQRLTAFGTSPVGAPGLMDALRLRPAWFSGAAEQPSQLGGIFLAAAALATGLCRHALVFRTVWEASDRTAQTRADTVATESGRVRGIYSWQAPFQSFSASNWIALYANRYKHLYGLEREQLAQVPLNNRRNAGLNPGAVYRDPLTLEDYLSSRMISSPLCLYDCDVPVDGSVALVLSRLDSVSGLRNPPVRIEAIGSAMDDRYSWDQYPDLSSMPAAGAASMMWGRTDLKPSDVDTAQLYDGFSFLTLTWLEALGFCGKGEAQEFVSGGHRISLEGKLPVNTDGGQLSAGRLHGYGYVHEACVQLWGRGGERQVADDPRTAAIGVGGGPFAGSLLLCLA